jgi:tetratricopeptide (TPR) repeat protein
VQSGVSYVYIFAGRIRDALAAAEAVLELTADRPELNADNIVESPRGFAAQSRGLVLSVLGHTREGLEALADNDRFLREHGHKENLSWQAYVRLLALRANGSSLDAMELAYEADEIADAVGGQYLKSCAQITLSSAHLASGRVDEAAEAAEAAIGLIEKLNTSREHEALARQLRALALSATGDPHQGMAEDERAIRCCVEQGNRFLLPWSCAAFATAAAAAATELNRALHVLDDGERVLAAMGARGFLPELLYARAGVHTARGEHDVGRDTLRRGLQIAEENGAHGWAKRFHDALADTTKPIDGQHEQPDVIKDRGARSERQSGPT